MTDFRLHTFLEVCREKSFTRAAEALHITQPAVTQHIKFLENDLGQALFRIQGRSIELTKAGELLLRYAQTVEADARRTRERIVSLGLRRSLRFGATRTIGEFVLPECIAGWMRDFPQTLLSMLVDNSDALFHALQRGDFDFIFVEGAFDRDAYTADLLFRDEMIPVCAARHPLASKHVPFSELLGETLIIREKGSGSRLLIEQAFASENRKIDAFAKVLEIGNIGAIKELVAAGTGIAFLYERSVARELASGELSRISVNGFCFSHDYSFVCLPRSLYEGEYRVFLDYCRRRQTVCDAGLCGIPSA
jgi:LysR family transcriptional regulator, transcriptional activator of the cysJI operon